MAMKGTSAGTSADSLLMVCVCMCVPHLQVCFFSSFSSFFFFRAFMSSNRNHRDRSQEGCGQVEEVRRATKHPSEGGRERKRDGGATESEFDK